MAAEGKTMGELADEYFGDISLFKVQPVVGDSDQVAPKELQETSLDEVIYESPSMQTPTINNSSQVVLTDENAGESASEICGCHLQDDEEQRPMQLDVSSPPNDESIEHGESPDKQDFKAKEGFENGDEECLGQDEINEVAESHLQDGHKDQRRSSFAYCDGSVEDLSIMIFPHEAPRHRKDSLGDVIIFPNEREIPEPEENVASDSPTAKMSKRNKSKVGNRRDGESCSGTSRDVAVQVGDEESGVGNRDDDEIENIPEDEEGPEEVDNTWSVLEAWSALAMVFGATPYRIVRNGAESEARSYAFSKTIWAINTILSAIGIANVLPKTFRIFRGEATPPALLQLGANFAGVLTHMAFWRALLFKHKYLLAANNRLVSSSYTSCKMSKSMAGLLLLMLVFIVFANTSLYIAYQSKYYSAKDFYSVQFNDIIQLLECRGQEALTWNFDNCKHAEYFTARNIFWSLAGLLMMGNSIIIQTVIVVGIIIICVSFFMATYETRCRQANSETDGNIVSRADYCELVDYAEELSLFVGETLLAYLILHGLQTPTMVRQLFMRSIVVFASILMSNGIIFFGLLFASLATLLMKWIWDDVLRQESRQQRPVGSARLRAFVSTEMWFKKSGIGIPGLFVINFPLMFTYVGILATLYGALFDMGNSK